MGREREGLGCGETNAVKVALGGRGGEPVAKEG